MLVPAGLSKGKNVESKYIDIRFNEEWDDASEKILEPFLAKSMTAIASAQKKYEEEEPGEEWRKEFQISLDAIHHIIETLKNNLAENAAIVIIGSNASRFILDEQPLAYKATRAALESLTRYYAVHLGVHGTRCNCVLVGGTIIKPEK